MSEIDTLVSFMLIMIVVLVGITVLSSLLSIFRRGDYSGLFSGTFQHQIPSITKYTSDTFKRLTNKEFVGLEIECIQGKNVADNEIVRNNLYKKGWDSSISGNGKEFRSAPMNGDRLLENTKDLLAELNKKDYKVDKSCGLHVHIETPHDLDLLKKLYIFYRKYERNFNSMLPKSRRYNHYCKNFSDKCKLSEIKNAEDIEEFKRLFYESNYYGGKESNQGYNKRYCWANFHSVFYRGTLEIRSHSGTLNYKKIEKWIRIHLELRNKLKRISTSELIKMKTDKEEFLKFFNKGTQEYIKTRWEKFKKRNKESELCV